MKMLNDGDDGDGDDEADPEILKQQPVKASESE